MTKQVSAKSPSALPRPVTRRLFLKWLGAVSLTTVACGAGVAYGYRVEPELLVTENVTITLSRLPAAFDGFLIAQLSDLHLGPYVSEFQIEQAISATNDAKPDAIVITGDLVNYSWKYIQPCTKLLSKLQAPLGAYVVFGNHDYYVGYLELLIASIKSAGLTLLRNQTVPIGRGRSVLYLVGLDDLWLKEVDLERALEGVPRTACKVALMHEPDFADYSAQAEVDLQLSGHSHGGQVRIPGIGPLILPQYGRKYPMGLQRAGNFTQVYTTRGIGLLPPPVRLNCPPELTLIRLMSG